MRRKLWIVAMALIALVAASRPPVLQGFCLTNGSTCSSASECCSNKCNCTELEGCTCIA